MSKLLQFIVSRMNGQKYGAPEFYWWVKENLPEEDSEPICSAIDSGCEAKVKQAINDHFTKHQLYPLALHYVSAVNWLQDDPEQSVAITYSTYVTMHSTEHANDNAEDEYEIEAVYQADARLTWKRKIQGAYEQALRHGHKPWHGLLLDVEPMKCAHPTWITIKADKLCRKLAQDIFQDQHAKNRRLPPEEQKEATIPNFRANIDITWLEDGKEQDLKFSKVLTLHVKHQHISAMPRSWYQRGGSKKL